MRRQPIRDKLQLIVQRLDPQLEDALLSLQRFAAIPVLPLELGQGTFGVRRKRGSSQIGCIELRRWRAALNGN